MKLTLSLDVREIALDGVDYYLISRDALAAVFLPPALATPDPDPTFKFKRPYTRKAAGGKKPAKAKQIPPSKGEAKPLREGSLMEAIVEAITNAPGRTPSVIFEAVNRKVPTTSASCYQTIKALEKKGLVEARENEDRGGVVGWYPKAT